MGKNGVVGTLTVSPVVLSNNRGNSHGDSNEAIMIDTNPDDVEPCEATLGGTPRSTLATAGACEPVNGPDPWFDRR